MTWAEFGSNIAQNPISIIAILIILILVIFGIKKGWFKYSGKGLQIGGDEKERRVIREQMEYVHNAIDALMVMFPSDKFDYYRTKYILKCVEDVYQSMIVYNHISTDEAYVKIKYDTMINAVNKRTDNEYFRSAEWLDFADKKHREILNQLIAIRKCYSKEN